MASKIIIPNADFSQNALITPFYYPTDSLVSCGGTILNDGNIWQYNESYYGSIILLDDFKQYSSIAIKSNATGNGINYSSYAFLIDTDVRDGEAARFATGYDKMLGLQKPSTWFYIPIPTDANSLYIYLKSNEIDFRPQELYFY